MSIRKDAVMGIVCRQARKMMRARPTSSFTAEERAALENHLGSCRNCSLERQSMTLYYTALDMAGTSERVEPGPEFFKALRARIERGPESLLARPEESWTAALFVTARQLIPAMAMLLALIIGPRLLWSSAPPRGASAQATVRPSERVMFNNFYDYPEPTADDVLETLVAVEEKENGK
jgi:hypothetical protein